MMSQARACGACGHRRPEPERVGAAVGENLLGRQRRCAAQTVPPARHCTAERLGTSAEVVSRGKYNRYRGVTGEVHGQKCANGVRGRVGWLGARRGTPPCRRGVLDVPTKGVGTVPSARGPPFEVAQTR
jgi:hypothetical protein